MNRNDKIKESQYGHCIRILEGITQKDYEQIKVLGNLCCEHDNINLKLELDYKLHQFTMADKRGNDKPAIMNEFLYYVDNELVSYVGVSCFDGKTGEVTGMTHPNWRKKGLFHKLLALAFHECQHGKYSKLFLLSDGNSKSGMHFLESSELTYAHSEYHMRRSNNITAKEEILLNPSTMIHSNRTSELDSINLAVSSPLTLRLACKADEKEITRQNILYFDDEEIIDETEEYKTSPLEDNSEHYKIYIVELEGEVIGKINVDYSNRSAFISGFGILPDYRGKGYGKAVLMETLCMIEKQSIPVAELDVLCTNSNALNLYKACGFEEESIMNYYEYKYKRA